MVLTATNVPYVRMAVTRARWLIGAAYLTLPLWSFWSPPVIPIALKLLVAALLVIAALRPLIGLVVLAGLGPLAVAILIAVGNAPVGGNAMLEVMVLAVVAGIAWHWCIHGPLTGGRLGRASFWLGVVAASSVITQGGVRVGAWWTHVTRGYFLQPRDFPAWHEAAVWVEALLLAVMIERVIRNAPDGNAAKSGRLIALVLACGLAGESAFSFLRLGQIASRSSEPLRALWQHALATRISPHFPDVNAIGSLFALGTICWLTIALGKQLSRGSRAGAVIGTFVMAAALWLTGSRAALGAALLTGLVMWWRLRKPSLTTMAASVAVAGTIALSLAATNAVQTPRASIGVALNIRIALATVGIRMAADHPALGVGLGEFSRQSSQYISPQLIEQFPPAAFGENAHNELIQVLGELGVIGLVVFVWYWSVVLAPAFRRMRDRKAPPWFLACTAGLCAFHLSALLGHPFLTPYVVYCVFMSVGALAGLTPDESRTPSRRT